MNNAKKTMTNIDDKQRLLNKISEKRHRISEYIDKNEPKNAFLVTFSIISGAIAAALTAGPGVGGREFIQSTKALIDIGIPIWQLLCIAATILSISAVIANTLLKTNNMTTKIAEARICDGKLEGLETLLELEQIDIQLATQQYIESLTSVPHI